MTDPVYCPHECYFERKEIVNWLRNYGGTCPVHRSELHRIEDLQDADWIRKELEDINFNSC